MNERDIIDRLMAGDESAFELLYYRYFNRLCVFACRFLSDYESSREVVQDVFFSLWASRSRLKSEKPILPYLLQAVKNKCFNLLEHEKVENKYLSVLRQAYIDDEYVCQHDQIQAEELELKIDEVLLSLPDRCREIFLMSRNKGMKQKEIAMQLGLSLKTVETQIGRALKRFRTQLSEYLLSFVF